ncbi:MAG TPA: hypothetical protein VF712_04515 [Thermoleophilaceae bacterium]|jgi:hypothetical protein
MVPLIFQCLALLAGAALLRIVLARLGLEVGIPQLAAVAVILYFAVDGAYEYRQFWKLLDDQRERNAGLSPEAARFTCTATGVDPGFLAYVADRIPLHERFYLQTEGKLVGGGDTCIRFLLLPRIPEADPLDARYLVFWNPPDNKVLDDARRRGATILRHRPKLVIARMP